MHRTVAILLSVLLLLCLFDMPYGFYQFVRFTATAGFAYLAWVSYEKDEKNMMFVFIILAALFQPFIKVALGRTIWNIVDVVAAAGLIIMAFKRNEPQG
ncbi:MAG: DUF6804 family protein [Flavobacteriales bacterium]